MKYLGGSCQRVLRPCEVTPSTNIACLTEIALHLVVFCPLPSRTFQAQAEEDESSAHTSAAAVDSDDVGCMEDTMFHGDHDQDDVDFHFPMEHEQRAGSVTPTNVNRTEIAILPPYPDGVTSPPPTVTVGYESLADLSHGHDLSSAIAASSGFVCTRRSPSSQELGGGVAWEAGGCGIESACEATGVGKVRAVLIPPPSREEQHAMMKELVMDQESRKLEPGERRYLLSLRCGGSERRALG